MSRLLYIDCVAGAAGDMLLAAMIDAGADPREVRAALRSLPLPDPLEFEVERRERHGIQATGVLVREVPEHEHRTWADVRAILDAGDLPERPLRRAHETFRRLAGAEARVHGVEPDQVHFHEVGARDAIADVCGVAVALESLGVDRVVCSPVPTARGFVSAAHGTLPLPAPATLELLRGVPLYGMEVGAEIVTPTGAALLTALAERFGSLPPMRLDAIGYGAGTRELERLPNVVRVLVGEPGDAEIGPAVSLIEANIDDLSPELIPDAAESCITAGALDVWTTPAQMKKGRPGVILSALARPERERAVAETLLRETSTLGVRLTRLERWELAREWMTVDVGGAPVRIKVGRLDGEIVNAAPEHDDCAALARQRGVPVKSVWQAAVAAAERANA